MNPHIKTQINDYFKNLNQQLKEDVGFEYTEEEQHAIMELAQNMQQDEPSVIDDLVELLRKVGYGEDDIQKTIDNLRAITGLRILIKIYEAIPKEKRDKILQISEKLSPTQSHALIETVYKNNTGEDLLQVVKSLHDDTMTAFHKDITALWEELNKS